VSELVHVLVEVGRHPRDLRFGEGVDAELLDQFVHPAGRDAGEVAVRNDRDQRCLGAFAALEEPLREVGSRAQFRDGDIDRPDASVEVPVSVAVALGRAVGAGFAPFGAGDGVRVGGQQGVDHGLQQAAHQIRRRVGEGFAKQAGRVDNMGCGHRDDAFRVEVRDFSKDHTVTALTSYATRRPPGYTTLRGMTATGSDESNRSV